MPFKELTFPEGLRLLHRWQAGEPEAKQRLQEIFTDVFSGQVDELFADPSPQNSVHVSGSIDLLTLGIVFDLFGITAKQLYQEDPERYVRSVLLTLKLLGMPKSYLSWPVYGFTAEALGQEMIYSDRYSPGTNPEVTLIDASNWQDLPPVELTTGIPKILDKTLDFYERLTGFHSVLHLSAPYSLAADIFGQEHLINALTRQPEMVNDFLDLLADRVLVPWMDHYFAQHPQGWVEFSDASGSPFFIGPRNCRDVAIRSIRRIIDQNPWGDRVYDANYRGDYVTQVSPRSGSGARRRKPVQPEQPAITLEELFEAKHGVCRDYVIRLADDRVDVELYVEEAIKRNIPLFMGVGATQIDRNTMADLSLASKDLAATINEHVAGICRVANHLAAHGYRDRTPPWPGTIYFEDVSAESSFELIEVIVGVVLSEGRGKILV